jgi:hypothetical protein
MKFGIKALLLISILFMLCSCNSVRQKILYNYNGVSITRIDMDGDETFFYYGDQTKEKNLREPDMKIFWGQRDGGFEAFFIFNADKSVEVVRSLGWFEVVKKSPDFYLTVKFDESRKDYDYISASKWFDGIKGKYNNILYVSSPPTKIEIERNAENKSKVIVKYL